VSEVVNDLDGDLMNFYGVLKSPVAFADLQHRLGLTLFSEAEWQNACEVLRGEEEDPVVRAAALFVQVRQSRSGLRKSFSPAVRTRLRGGRNDGVNAWWRAVDGLADAHRRLRDALVLNRPALNVIASEDRPSTLFYCDPPYLHDTRAATRAYGPHEMTEDDHRQLLDTLRACRGKVMLSGYPSGLYDTALAGWNRHTFDLPNNAAGGKAKGRETEVL
jgi:DNA adenine methylase